ncbi:transglycosylase SLT domain-containing protein [Clostridium hydrogeniformans]|uniref:transglycosylase SLT domain-containing protein n=1 Tax=Clostridium hydrogeniformans TaxID=349933 RepID=UPI00068FAF9F|nr:transglycosylase SLT domain-containing protein [Clostridium hydrogeniformans]
MKKKIFAGIIVALIGIYAIGAFLIYPLKNKDILKKYSEEFKVDKYVLAAIIKEESGFRNEDFSYKKEDKIGVMQIRDFAAEPLAKELGIEDFKGEDLTNKDTNIKIGTYYLSKNYNEKDLKSTMLKWQERNVSEKNPLMSKETAESLSDSMIKTSKMYKIFHPGFLF